MNPFTEVGREVNDIHSEIRQIKSSLYNYVENYKLESIKNRLDYLESKVTNIENDLSYLKETVEELKNKGE